MRSELAIVLLALVAGCGPNRTHPMREGLDAAVARLDCVPNLDGVIDAAEVAPVIGVPMTYLLNPPGEERTVDLAGAVVGDRRTWDLGADYASDLAIEIAARPIAGSWFAASFPTAEFAAPLDVGATLLGVYRHEPNALELLGIVSAEMSPPEGRTEIRYETPIAVLVFPLTPGAHWVGASDVRNATLRGLPYAGRDTYDVTVVAEGTAVLPDLSFDRALRVATTVTVEPAAGVSVTRRQSSYFFECFGEVARAVSRDGETTDEFTTAAELRRLGFN
jgi:hypothetical protein